MDLLSVENLNISLPDLDGMVTIIQDLSFSVKQGEKLGIVGESGCGKSLTALALMALLPENARVSGRISLKGHELQDLNSRQLSTVRGNQLGMIFQEPMTALNPVKTIGAQVSESLIIHRRLTKKGMQEKVEELMEQVGMPVSRFPLNLYPHQLSGGQRQRIMIAMAIACQPDLLIADEPTTALDVTVQKQILDLIDTLVHQLDMALVIISHDLGVIGQMTENVMVMYSGRVVERGPTQTVFSERKHPYTSGLFSAMPRIGLRKSEERRRLTSVPGQVPDYRDLGEGCSFADRCSFVTEECRGKKPPQIPYANGHEVLCFHPVSGRSI